MYSTDCNVITKPLIWRMLHAGYLPVAANITTKLQLVWFNSHLLERVIDRDLESL